MNTKRIIATGLVSAMVLSQGLTVSAKPVLLQAYGTETTKKYTKKNVLDHEFHIISVAKGATRELEGTKSDAVSASVTGDMSPWKLGLKYKSSISIKDKSKFVGPPETSKYNSREYKAKFLVNKGEWKKHSFVTLTYVYDFQLDDAKSRKEIAREKEIARKKEKKDIKLIGHGNFMEPSKVIQFSVDSFQKVEED